MTGQTCILSSAICTRSMVTYLAISYIHTGSVWVWDTICWRPQLMPFNLCIFCGDLGAVALGLLAQLGC